MRKLILLILLCCLLSGCSFIACGDRGVDRRYGFLWLKYKCIGNDLYCKKCGTYIRAGEWTCEEACKK